jgi:calcyphosin
VTVKEFCKYYANLSSSIDEDDYFELMMRNAWHISGGEGWCANTTCRRVLVTHTDGTQTVEEIQVPPPDSPCD